jgi:hypothetical protein
MNKDASSLSFEANTLDVAGRAWSWRFPIADARLVDDVVVVIYDYMAGSSQNAAFPNVEGFDLSGRKLWTAEHPTNGPADVYVEFIQLRPLILWNFACYRCTIDPATGKLLDAVFTR